MKTIDRSVLAGLVLITLLSTLINSQTTYVWIGGTNANFSTAGNWSPLRQIGRNNDRLIFNNGLSNVISGVNQITFAQLLITGNTSVTFIPSSGNSRIIFIEGDLSDSPDDGNTKVIADLKYREYEIKEKIKDIATIKYTEYNINDTIKQNDLATQKYSEYRIKSVQGMGDLKVNTNITDNPNNSNIYIENGSTFRINSSNPSLSILLRSNAKAEIYGTIILEGQILNSLNSNDPYSIYFKSGSKIIQRCPGNLFNSTGTGNTIVFESGSSLEIENSQALNPFALESPNSKIIFEEGSKFKISAPCSNALRLSGRNYSLLEINSNLNLNEIIIDDCNIKNLLINPNASLTIRNLNNSSQVPTLKIKGDITLNGDLFFPENSIRNMNISIDGTEVQTISGSGLSDFNSSIETIQISNSLIVNKDITANCNVTQINGAISCTGHTFIISGNFISPFSLPPGVIIQSSQSGNKKTGNSDKLAIKEEFEKKNRMLVEEAKWTAVSIPETFTLSQNYPNPFNPATTIEYGLPYDSYVSLKVYDITGKEISVIFDGTQKAGSYKKIFSANNLPSGVYFYKLTGVSSKQNFSKTNKMILTK